MNLVSEGVESFAVTELRRFPPGHAWTPTMLRAGMITLFGTPKRSEDPEGHFISWSWGTVPYAALKLHLRSSMAGTSEVGVLSTRPEAAVIRGWHKQTEIPEPPGGINYVNRPSADHDGNTAAFAMIDFPRSGERTYSAIVSGLTTLLGQAPKRQDTPKWIDRKLGVIVEVYESRDTKGRIESCRIYIHPDRGDIIRVVSAWKYDEII